MPRNSRSTRSPRRPTGRCSSRPRRTARSIASPRAEPSTVFFDPEDKYIWALALDAQGRLYVATGDKGVIYRVAADGASEVFCRTETTNVTSLLPGPDGQMFASTESPGRVLRIAPSGKAFVLLDSPYREVRALRAGGAGTIYAAAVNGKPGAPESAAPAQAAEPPRTVPVASVSAEIMAVTIIDTSSAAAGAAPAQRTQPEPAAKGALYRIDAAGGNDLIWEFRDDQPFDLLVEDGGSLLAATGSAGRIYRLAGEPWRAMLLTRFDAQQVTALLGTGALKYFATSNPAHVVRVDAGLRCRRPLPVGRERRRHGRGVGRADVAGHAAGARAPCRFRPDPATRRCPTTRGATGPAPTSAPRATP